MSRTDLPALSIIVPVRSERPNVVEFVQRVQKTLPTSYRMLMVYDEIDDETLTVEPQLLAIDPTLRLLKNEFGRGVVNAIRTGLNHANAPLVLVMMADLSDTPETIPALLRKCESGFDVVIASRYCVGGKSSGPRLKRWLSRASNWTLSQLIAPQLHDYTNAFALYRKCVLEKIQIESRGGFEFTMELILKAKALGFRIAEVPTENVPRRAGRSHFRMLAWLPHYLNWYVRLIFSDR